tara:strand:+ start:688 stop:1104 length:417 start_codon:yes stop_codon:yes gene_type:complete
MSYKPDFPYLGEQIIITSGRVILNSKDDSVFLFGKKAIGFSSAGTINFDSDDKIIINAPQIYLGLEAKEPLVKGKALETLLTDLLDSLEELGEKLMLAVDSNGVYLTSITTSGRSLQRSIKRVKSNLKSIKSTKNFTV